MGPDPNLINPPPEERESFTDRLEDRLTKRKARSADQLADAGRLHRVSNGTADERAAREAARQADVEARRQAAAVDLEAKASQRGQTVAEFQEAQAVMKARREAQRRGRYPGPRR